MEEKEFLEQVLVTRSFVDEKMACKPISCKGCTGGCPDSSDFRIIPADLIFEEALGNFKEMLNECDSKDKYFDVIPTLLISKSRDNVLVREMVKDLIFENEDKDISVQNLLDIYKECQKL